MVERQIEFYVAVVAGTVDQHLLAGHALICLIIDSLGVRKGELRVWGLVLPADRAPSGRRTWG